MPRTPTTRHGNGAGHGGPARGAGKGPAQGTSPAFTADSETRETTAHLANGDSVEQAYRATQQNLKRKRREDAWKALDALVADTAHAWHGNAIKETLNRTEGVPVQKTEITGADGDPLKIETIRRVIVDPNPGHRNP